MTLETPIEDIVEHFRGEGIDYNIEWLEWFWTTCIGGDLCLQNWKPRDFTYVVEDGKVWDFKVDNGRICLLDEVPHMNPATIQQEDKVKLQNYGRSNDDKKPSGTYIHKPVLPLFGEGGLQHWPSQHGGSPAQNDGYPLA